MTDQIIDTNNPIQPAPTISNPPISEPKTRLANNLAVKFKPIYKALSSKLIGSPFYKNKMIFWPVTIAFGLILLIIIAGLLFGKRNIINNTINKVATPTPQIQATSQPVINDQYSPIEQNLNDLKNQITNLDVKQSQLQPPTVNYNVKF